MPRKAKLEFLFLNENGAGYASRETVTVGTTVESFLSGNMQDWNSGAYTIRVNNDVVTDGQLLVAGDRVIVSPVAPAKIESA